jgi:hypothetical protein
MSLDGAGMVCAGGTEITTEPGRKVSRGYPLDLPSNASRSGTEDVKFSSRQCRGSAPVQAINLHRPRLDGSVRAHGDLDIELKKGLNAKVECAG